jgi:uncharacterized damage-inducible protein DinB
MERRLMQREPCIEAVLKRSRTEKSLAERAIAQLSDGELHKRPAPGFNSVATIVRHVAGNLISRWTDFLSTDGDKPDRDRESEFADWPGSRQELMQRWERGFQLFFDIIESLSDEDLTKTVYIRSEPHTVPLAIVRSATHTAYHVGQILYIARLVHEGDWKYLTVAPGASEAFNRQMETKRGKR